MRVAIGSDHAGFRMKGVVAEHLVEVREPLPSDQADEIFVGETRGHRARLGDPSALGLGLFLLLRDQLNNAATRKVTTSDM